MSWLRPAVRHWLPVVLWASLIFVGSGDVLSENRTSRFLGPLLRWFLPGVSDARVSQIQGVIRKGGHVTEYAILAWLALRGFTRSRGLLPPAWAWRPAALAFGLCVLYASADEIRQAFVPSRFGSPVDVMIDSLGAALGLGAAWWQIRRQKQARPLEVRGAVRLDTPR